jgi:hypothetical protein
VRHGVLLGGPEHDLAGQPVEQERLHLGRAHPQRPAEVLLASVADDVIRTAAGRSAVGQVLGLVGREELDDEHCPSVAAPRLPARLRAGPRRLGLVDGQPSGRTADGPAVPCGLARGRQRPDPGPDERVVGGEGLADRRVGCLVRDRERGLQQAPGLGGGDRPEAAAPVAVPAPFQQRVHPGGDPAVGQHPGGVVVDLEDQGVRLGPAVAEQAHGLVAIPERVRVHVAVPGGHGAHVLGPARSLDPALDQDEGSAFRRGGLPGRAQAGDAGQQRQRRRALVLARVRDQPLPDHFLQIGVAGAGAGLAFPPPGAQQFADHELGVERAAHREQLP